MFRAFFLTYICVRSSDKAWDNAGTRIWLERTALSAVPPDWKHLVIDRNLCNTRRLKISVKQNPCPFFRSLSSHSLIESFLGDIKAFIWRKANPRTSEVCLHWAVVCCCIMTQLSDKYLEQFWNSSCFWEQKIASNILSIHTGSFLNLENFT